VPLLLRQLKSADMQKSDTVSHRSFGSIIIERIAIRLVGPFAPLLASLVLFFGWPTMLPNEVQAQTSQAERTGFWSVGSSWVGGTMPGSLASNTITTTGAIVVINGTIKSMYSLSFSLSNVSINAGDTLIILGNLQETGSLLSNNGVLIVYGNVTNAGSNNAISGSGKMVVTGNYNNALGANSFTGPSYVFGSTSGFLFPPAVGNASSLQTNDPGLFNYVQNTYTVLPIELLDFEANVEDHEVQLKWSTVSETNNDHFIIERSHDGVQFEEVATVPGSGNSRNKVDYEYWDRDPLFGRSYYRLGQVDLDGQTSDPHVTTVVVEGRKPFEIYPNPTTDYLYFSGAPTELSVSVTDFIGRHATYNPIVVEAEGKK
jgi:hypothetical protein